MAFLLWEASGQAKLISRQLASSSSWDGLVCWLDLIFFFFFFLKQGVGDFCEPLRLAEGLQVRLKSALVFTAHKLLDFDFADV